MCVAELPPPPDTVVPDNRDSFQPEPDKEPDDDFRLLLRLLIPVLVIGAFFTGGIAGRLTQPEEPSLDQFVAVATQAISHDDCSYDYRWAGGSSEEGATKEAKRLAYEYGRAPGVDATAYRVAEIPKDSAVAEVTGFQWVAVVAYAVCANEQQ